MTCGFDHVELRQLRVLATGKPARVQLEAVLPCQCCRPPRAPHPRPGIGQGVTVTATGAVPVQVGVGGG
eukprot:516693-Rhodomonas_salina.1